MLQFSLKKKKVFLCCNFTIVTVIKRRRSLIEESYPKSYFLYSAFFINWRCFSWSSKHN